MPVYVDIKSCEKIKDAKKREACEQTVKVQKEKLETKILERKKQRKRDKMRIA